jgi:uncharacterized membrane protein YfcA
MSVGLLAWVALAIAIASFAQSLAGFGFALLCVPIMTVFVAPHDAVIISTAIGCFSTTAQAYVDRANTDWVFAKRMIMASFLGMPIGLAVFISVPETILRFTLGIVVIVAAFALWRGFSLTGKSNRIDWVLGALSGALSTSLSTNGPPIVFVMQARQIQPNTFRATINTIFSAAGIASLGLFIAAGKVDKGSFSGILVALPVLAVSVSIGYRLRKHVHGDRFRTLVLGLLMLSGASAIVAALTH